jgi:dTDP-glucose pyrophosphorylase/predicted transcriptional regulator
MQSKELSKILLKLLDTLEVAIKVLHSGGKRIALVVDNNRRLIGTVTDGDIRRALIKRISMDCTVEEVMNSMPITASNSDTPELIFSKMQKKDLLHIPIVDNHGILVGLEILQELFESKKHNNPVFLMAGGFGTRLHPLTRDKPKPLLNVGNCPILETILTRFINSGFHNFYISVHYKAEMIREYFGDGSNWGVNIEYIYEEKPLGTAGSLGLLPSSAPKLPVIVMNGDILTKVNFENMLEFHCQQKGLATMCVREYELQVPYGVVSIKNQYVNGIIEKPVQEFFVNAGIYILNQKIINNINGALYLDMPNLLETQVEKGEKISVFPIHEYWSDIGQMEEYENAHKIFSGEFMN